MKFCNRLNKIEKIDNNFEKISKEYYQFSFQCSEIHLGGGNYRYLPPDDAAKRRGGLVLYATAIGLGVLGVLVLLATLLLCLLELLRMVLLWREKERYRSFTPQERIFYKKDKLFWLLALWGMDAALGWKTEKTDRALTLRLPAVSEGEYQRICSLLEKTVYGGIMLEPFEERALDRFLYHLTGQDMKKSLGMWLKLHYACLKKRK